MPYGPIYQKSFDFALNIIRLCYELNNAKEYVLSKQLLRSATSIGANVNEASAGQSKRDFIAKMAIASKEARETLCWLRLLSAGNVSSINYTTYISDSEELVRILTAIIKTAQLKALNTKH